MTKPTEEQLQYLRHYEKIGTRHLFSYWKVDAGPQAGGMRFSGFVRQESFDSLFEDLPSAYQQILDGFRWCRCCGAFETAGNEPSPIDGFGRAYVNSDHKVIRVLGGQFWCNFCLSQIERPKPPRAKPYRLSKKYSSGYFTSQHQFEDTAAGRQAKKEIAKL